MDKVKRYLYAALLAAHSMRKVTRDEVQQIKQQHKKKMTLRKAIALFHADKMLATKFARELESHTDATCRDMWPTVAPLWSDLPPNTCWSSKLPQQPPVSVDSMLKQLNAARKKLKLPPFKSWKGSRAQLETRLQLTLSAIIAHKDARQRSKVAVARAPTVVAEDAYRTPTEALNATGHTTKGLHKGRVKDRARLERYVNGKQRPEANGHVSKTDTGDTITLADVAREQGVDPRVARAKARRHADIIALAISGWTFHMVDKEKLARFVGGAGA